MNTVLFSTIPCENCECCRILNTTQFAWLLAWHLNNLVIDISEYYKRTLLEFIDTEHILSLLHYFNFFLDHPESCYKAFLLTAAFVFL
jgi:hypothetical protein